MSKLSTNPPPKLLVQEVYLVTNGEILAKFWVNTILEPGGSITVTLPAIEQEEEGFE